MNEELIRAWMEEVYRNHLNGADLPAIRVGTFRGDASAAVFSPCGGYRYVLARVWDESAPLWLFAMLNPSVASEQSGDSTVNRQVTRVKSLGGGGIIVVNAGGLVQTDRRTALLHADPIGPDNERLARPFVNIADRHVVAYGADAVKFGGERLLARLLAGKEVFSLGTTKKGFPRHPLYVAYAVQPQTFAMPALSAPQAEP